MIFFDFFCLLLATALVTVGIIARSSLNLAQYRSALGLFVAAVILYYPVSGLFTVGVYISFVARPIAVVLGVLSLRGLCLALVGNSADS